MIRSYSIDDLIAVGLAVVGLLAFYEAHTSFPFEEGAFPKMASGLMVVAAVIWLLRGFLPEFLYSALVEFDEPDPVDDAGDVDDVAEVEGDVEEVEGAVADGSPEDESEELSPIVPLIALTIGYAGLAYLIGFLWATPFFVTAYGYHRDFEARDYVVVNAVAFAVVFGFAFFTTYQIDQGIVWGFDV